MNLLLKCFFPDKQLEVALESLPDMPDVDVSRFELLDGGSQWTVTFPADAGDVPSLFLDSSGLSGTMLLASVSEDVAGEILGGTFQLYSNDGSGSGFPAGNEGRYLGLQNKGQNSTGRSTPLAWNSNVNDVRKALEFLLPSYASQGG